MENKKILIEVSNRHVHLSREHINILFGKNYKLKIYKLLSQPGQFAAQEKIDLIKNNKKIENIRILGPERPETQVEILKKDAEYLGIETPVRISGDLENTPGLILQGPNGRVELKKGVILSHRHLHASEDEAKELGINHGQIVNVKVHEPEMTLNKVVVVVRKDFKLSVHIDKQEAEVFSIGKQDKETFGELVF